MKFRCAAAAAADDDDDDADSFLPCRYTVPWVAGELNPAAVLARLISNAAACLQVWLLSATMF